VGDRLIKTREQRSIEGKGNLRGERRAAKEAR